MATSLKVFCSEQSSSRGGIEIAQLVADWLIRLPIRTCVKPPVTSDCSLAPNLLFVDWLKILANEKQAVQFQSPLVLVCEQKRCSHIQSNLYVKQNVLSSGAVCWECGPLLWGYIDWKTSSWWTSQSNRYLIWLFGTCTIKRLEIF